MQRIGLVLAFLLVLSACAKVTVETTRLSGGTLDLPSSNPTTAALDEAAEGICAEHAWAGIREPGSFEAEAAALGVTAEAVAAAARRHCPEAFYQPLSKAETDWCGDGRGFGNNFFRVVAAGVDLGIASFTIVEPGLLAKASSRNVELTDYEIELFTAELQTMSESSRFDRDWAEACRSTF